MPVEDRIASFAMLIDEVKQETPNSIKAMNMLMRIVDPERTAAAGSDLAWDKVGLGGIVFDVATLGATVAFRTINTIRTVGKSLDNADLAADLATLASKSDDVAGALGTDRVSAAAHLQPMAIPEEIIGGAPDSVRRAVAQRTAENQAVVQALREQTLHEGLDILVDKDVAHARMITEIERRSPIEISKVEVVDSSPTGATLRVRYYDHDGTGRSTAEMNAMAQVDSMGASGYRITNRSDDGFDVAFRIEGDEAERLVNFKYPDVHLVEMPYVVDDITGGFRQTRYGPGKTFISKLLSPQAKFDTDIRTLVDAFTISMFQGSAYRQALQRRFGEIYRITDAKGRERVGHALQQGSLKEEVFDYHTLRDVYNLSDRDVEAYYAFRSFMDQAHAMKNNEMRERLLAQGLRQYTDNFNNKYYVKPYETPGSASAAILGTEHTAAYIMNPGQAPRPINLRAGTQGDVSPEVQKLFDDGYVMIRGGAGGQYFKVGGTDVDNFSAFLFVRSGEVKDIGPKVLNYRTGYTPLIYGPDANYFGQKSVYGKVDGITRQVGTTTPIYFTNRVQADEWARTQNFDHLTKKYGSETEALRRLDDPHEQLPFSVKYDREMNAEEFESVAQMSMGGLYTGARGSERLKKGTPIGEEAAEFIDVYESMQRYMDNISNNLPIASYRVGIENKWLQHAKDNGALPQNFNLGFKDAYWHIARNDNLDQGLKKFLMESHDHISYNVRVPSLGEREIASWMRTAAERMEINKLPGMGPEGMITKTLHRLDHANPVDAVRAATFHSLLGVYNPAQYVVQGMGSTVAIAADPLIFPRAFPTANLFHLLDNIKNPQALSGAIRRLEGIDPQIGVKWEAWRKMGMYADIVQSRADYVSMARSHHIGSDLIQRIFRRGGVELERGLFAYKAGELWNRRYSVAASMERYLQQNPNITALTDNDIKTIMNKSNIFMLNMHRTAKAEWQKGILSIPTQFMQVHTKFIESLFGTGLSAAEKRKLAVGQVAIFGALGVPFGNYVAGHVAGALAGDDQHLPEWQLEGLRAGFTGLFLTHWFGVDNIVAQRGAIPFGIGEMVERIFDDNANWGQVLLGATGGALDRTAEAAITSHRILSSTQFDPTLYEANHLAAAVNEWMKIASTWRNVNIAYSLMNNELLRDSRGNPLLYSDDINFQSTIAQGLGFQLNDLAKLYELERTTRDTRDHVRNLTDALFMTYYKIYGEDGVDEGQKKAFEALIASQLKSEPPSVRQSVLDSFQRRLLNPETRYERAVNDYVQRLLDENIQAMDYLMRGGEELFSGGEE
jgi:hypothetical protein